jgi:mannose-6-phosphate isomerase-like protein (cupin superfamily)
MAKSILQIKKDGQVFAIVLRREFAKPGVHFFTPGEFSQQLGMLIHPKGKVVDRHRHKHVRREIQRTQEVLVLLEGRIEIEIYTEDALLLKTVRLKAGDAILLAAGGHRVKMLEGAKIIEVKQGPYAGYVDKEYF